MKTWLSVVAGSTLIVYGMSSGLPIFFNVTTGDMWLLVCSFLIVFSPPSQRSLWRFHRAGYGLLAALISASMPLVSLMSSTFDADLKFIVQFWFILWIVIPLVAVGVAEMPSPLRYLTSWGWAALALMSVGAVLQFAFGIDWILYNSGINRFILKFNVNAFLSSAFCLSVALMTTRSWSAGTLLMCALSVFALAVVGAQRSGVAMVAVVLLMASAVSIRTWRGIAAMVATTGIATILLSSGFFQSLLGIRAVTGIEFFHDENRIDALIATVQSIVSHPSLLVAGVGWGRSGFETAAGVHLVVHNVPLQLVVEAGLPIGLMWLWLLALPVFWLWRARQVDRVERRFALMLNATLWVIWAVNPMSSERVNWLTFAMALGMAYRLRKEQQSVARHARATRADGMSKLDEGLPVRPVRVRHDAEAVG